MTDSKTDPQSLLVAVTTGRILTAAEAEAVFDHFMSGEASPLWMAAILSGLQARGVAPSEVAGGVRALRTAMIPVDGGPVDDLVDTCGTGGGTVTTFNISTAAAIVAAGAGVRLAKHGNRSFTSRSGSADVLEALGVGIELSAERMGAVLRESGLVFMFAPLLHPAMRHVGPVRRELGVRTVMNVLGPLTNPAGVRRQVVGVSDPDLAPLLAGALRELGHIRALVVYGEPGMDEISPIGETRVHDLHEGRVTQYALRPSTFGFSEELDESLGGGEPEENADRILAVLNGSERGAARTAVVMNAAAAIVASGQVEEFGDAVEAARRSVDEGGAAEALERLRAATRD